MRRRLLTQTFVTLLLCLAAGSSAAAQDFQKSYQLGPNGSVRIENVSGNVNIVGYDGSAVTVSAFKEGRDRDVVQVEDLSAGDRVHLRARYPEDCRRCNASLRFEVRVPRGANVNLDKITTASGDVSATDVAGDINLNTASGDINLQGVSGKIEVATASGQVRVRNAAGSVSASSASGDVEVEIARLEGTRDLRFSSASGNVSVRLPNDLDARVSVSTASGQIDTDFPLEVKRQEYGSGSTARGQLGGGSRSLRISTASGDVSLKSL
jgi:Putative adhesin